MSKAADFVPVRSLIEGCWPGEWGSDPIADNANCVVFRATDIDSDGHLDLDGGASRFVLPAKIKAKSLNRGDILLEASGGAPDKPVGRVALVDEAPHRPSLTSNFFRFIRPEKGVDSRFLLFQLVALNRSSSIWRYQQQTTGLINLKVEDYLCHKIWVPSAARQKKIADILSSVDICIKKTEALIAKYQQVSAGMMHDLFTRGVLPTGQMRPPRSEAPELYQETAIGLIPREWTVVQAISVCSLITKGTTPASHQMWQDGDGVRFLRVDNLTFDGQLNFEASSFRVSDETHMGGLARSRCLPGDVLTNIVGPPLGKVGLVTSLTGELNINQAIAVFRPREVLNSAFLLRWLTTETVKRWFLQRAKQTSGQLNLTLAMCQTLPIPLMNLSEQDLILGRAQSCEKLLHSELVKLRLLKAEKLGLMQDLLTGRVPVRVENPAPELVNG
jgi:type I restriction enzyme S subunit